MNALSPELILSEVLDEEIRTREEVLFIPSPGNGGDALISFQAYELLAKLKVNFSTVSFDHIPQSFEGKIVIIGGGGGLVPHYKFLPELLSNAAASAKKVVVLPQSVRGLDSLLQSLAKNVYLLTRDRPSLSHVSTLALNANIYESSDLALDIDSPKMFSMPPSTIAYLRHQLSISKYHFRIGVQRTFAWALLVTSTRLRQILTGNHTLIAIRSDIEATITPPKGKRNVDISAHLEYNDMSRLGAELTTYRMLKYISLHKKVITNRLHVGIGAHLLGIETKLLDNSYGKIAAVYEQSLIKSKSLKLIKHPTHIDFD